MISNLNPNFVAKVSFTNENFDSKLVACALQLPMTYLLILHHGILLFAYAIEVHTYKICIGHNHKYHCCMICVVAYAKGY